MPPGNHFAQFRVRVPNLPQVSQAGQERAPIVGDQSQQERVSAVATPGTRRLAELSGVEVVLLEVDSGVTVDLGIEKGIGRHGRATGVWPQHWKVESVRMSGMSKPVHLEDAGPPAVPAGLEMAIFRDLRIEVISHRLKTETKRG